MALTYESLFHEYKLCRPGSVYKNYENLLNSSNSVTGRAGAV